MCARIPSAGVCRGIFGAETGADPDKLRNALSNRWSRSSAGASPRVRDFLIDGAPGFDGFDFTPLMYAATIDFGDTRSLQALLKAGADPNIRNAEGLTAIEQARKYRHGNFEAVLK